MTGFLGWLQQFGATAHGAHGFLLTKFLATGLLLAMILAVLGFSFVVEALHPRRRASAGREHRQQA